MHEVSHAPREKFTASHAHNPIVSFQSRAGRKLQDRLHTDRQLANDASEENDLLALWFFLCTLSRCHR
jgi:hypothetical protein